MSLFDGMSCGMVALQRANIDVDEYYASEIDKFAIKVVEEMDNEVNGRFAELKIVEIPDDVSWEIVEYDGMEHIAEIHRTWG